MHKSLVPDHSGRFTDTKPVEEIQPVEGWELLSIDCFDGDGFSYAEYVARGPVRDVMLDVSRFCFTPSQDRFSWLVRNGFPPRPAFGPWDDTDIDGRLAAEALLVKCLAEREQAIKAVQDNLMAVHDQIQALSAGERQ